MASIFQSEPEGFEFKLQDADGSIYYVFRRPIGGGRSVPFHDGNHFVKNGLSTLHVGSPDGPQVECNNIECQFYVGAKLIKAQKI